jgi:hypothetical protein
MTISGNYPNPVTVNGYSCKNCTDVDYAKKHIDPAHPKDGPYGVNAKADPSRANDPAVKFGGGLVGLASALNTGTTPTATQGLRLDVSA